MSRIFILACFIWTTALHAQWSPQSPTNRWTLAFSGGYGQGSFGWSIAGNADGTSPNVLSELQWKKLGGAGANACIRYSLGGRFFVSFSGQLFSVVSAEVIDVDYTADNRTHATYDARFHSNSGHTDNGSIALGYQFFSSSKLQLSGRVGCELLHRMFDVSMSYDERLYPTGGVHSSYRSRSSGVTGSLEAAFFLTSALTLNFDAGYSILSYDGEGNWNLNPNLQHPKSFEQTAVENELHFQLTFFFHLTNNNACFIRAAAINSHTGSGDDALHPINGNIVLTRFNGANANAASISIGWQKRLK